jgi:acyl-[acyl-carrier-protein] desaturase
METPERIAGYTLGQLAESSKRPLIERDADLKVVETEQLMKSLDRNARSSWHPEKSIPIDEIKQMGHYLSEDTINILEGFLGIEEYIGDFMRGGLQGLRRRPQRRRQQLLWGREEFIHGMTLENVLKYSGARTQAQIDTYQEQLLENEWSVSQHKGMTDEIGGALYPLGQERVTEVSYYLVKGRVRAEYGLPEEKTAKERERGFQYGAAEALNRIMLDEGQHHGYYSGLVIRGYLPNFPVETLERLLLVLENFDMPSIRFLPNGHEYIRSVKAAGLHLAPEKFNEMVILPMITPMGFEDKSQIQPTIDRLKELGAAA